jgi:hypothetical protein
VIVDPEDERELDAAEAVSDELYELVAGLGGSIAGEHGVGVLKRGRLARQWAPRAVALHEQIKRAFDPKGLLNPGKKLARYPPPAAPAGADRAGDGDGEAAGDGRQDEMRGGAA